MKIDLENLSMDEIEMLVGQLRQMKLESYMMVERSKAYLRVAEAPRLLVEARVHEPVLAGIEEM